MAESMFILLCATGVDVYTQLACLTPS